MKRFIMLKEAGDGASVGVAIDKILTYSEGVFRDKPCVWIRLGERNQAVDITMATLTKKLNGNAGKES